MEVSTKKRSSIVIVLMIFALIGLITAQVYWINTSIDLNEQLFRQQVNESLANVARKIELDEATNDQIRIASSFAPMSNIEDSLIETKKALQRALLLQQQKVQSHSSIARHIDSLENTMPSNTRQSRHSLTTSSENYTHSSNGETTIPEKNNSHSNKNKARLKYPLKTVESKDSFGEYSCLNSDNSVLFDQFPPIVQITTTSTYPLQEFTENSLQNTVGEYYQTQNTSHQILNNRIDEFVRFYNNFVYSQNTNLGYHNTKRSTSDNSTQLNVQNNKNVLDISSQQKSPTNSNLLQNRRISRACKDENVSQKNSQIVSQSTPNQGAWIQVQFANAQNDYYMQLRQLDNLQQRLHREVNQQNVRQRRPRVYDSILTKSNAIVNTNRSHQIAFGEFEQHINEVFQQAEQRFFSQGDGPSHSFQQQQIVHPTNLTYTLINNSQSVVVPRTERTYPQTPAVAHTMIAPPPPMPSSTIQPKSINTLHPFNKNSNEQFTKNLPLQGVRRVDHSHMNSPAGIQPSTEHGNLSTTNNAMEEDRISKKMSLWKDVFSKLGEYTMPLNKRISADKLRAILTKEFSEKGLPTDFRFSVLTNNDKEVLYASYDEAEQYKSSPYKATLFPSDILAHNARLALIFPTQNIHIMSANATNITLSLIFLITIIGCFIWTMQNLEKHKKISEMKSDFINNMTHELKTPIATIALASDALRDPIISASSDRVSRFLSVIKEENTRLATQVERVLQAARMERGELSLTMEPVDINAIIDTAMTSIELQVESRGGSITFSPQAQNPLIVVDELHVQNVLLNLFDNALKYTVNTPEIRISSKNEQDGITIDVTDNGIGISRDHIRRIFDKLYRVPTGNVHNVKGFGLGLSYVKDIVEVHGGRVTVSSIPNSGSTFSVFLPYNTSNDLASI